MATPYIPGFDGEAFDLFDALGLVPKSSYSAHDLQVAWRAAFKILHSDRKHINGKYVPKFPTVDQITRARDFLSEHPENIELAHEALAESYQSTWNPYAKAGTRAVLQPIPGAVAEPLPYRPFEDSHFYVSTRGSQRMHRTDSAAEYPGTRAAREADRSAYPPPGDRNDHRPWRERRKEKNFRRHEKSQGPDGDEIIDGMMKDKDLKDLLRARNIQIR